MNIINKFCIKRKIRYYEKMLNSLPKYGWGNKDEIVYRLICILEYKLNK